MRQMDGDATVRLMLGYLCISGEAAASLLTKINILDRFKLQDAEIAQICGCGVQAVRNARLANKKRSHAKR